MRGTALLSLNKLLVEVLAHTAGRDYTRELSGAKPFYNIDETSMFQSVADAYNAGKKVCDKASPTIGCALSDFPHFLFGV